MDISLGQILLTKNQMRRLSELHTEIIKGFTYWNSAQNIIVTTTKNLSGEEKSQLITQLKALSDIPIPQIPQKPEKEHILEVLGLKEEDISTLKAVTAEKASK